MTAARLYPEARVVEHLEREAKGASHLVLWLDCDREGKGLLPWCTVTHFLHGCTVTHL